jgi:hypothetical protein
MTAFIVFLASLLLLGASLFLRRRRPRVLSNVRAPASAPVNHGQDLLPEGGDGQGLAAFYAYQMAAGSIDRPR